MDPIPCLSCNFFFIPRNHLQTFCSGPDCQRARKALWQNKKITTDPEYKRDQSLAQQKWLQNNPGYWKEYRKRNPGKVQRNRSLQKIRNLKRSGVEAPPKTPRTVGIAKMDARKIRKDGLFGEYWIIPIDAKMDAVKIYITSIPTGSP